MRDMVYINWVRSVISYMARLFNLGLLLFTTLVAAPAWSEIYKWVDDNGVVNYSNRPPYNRKVEELDLNSVTVSVIETDKTDQRAAWVVKSEVSEVSALRQKVDQLESQLEAERYARQYTAGSVAIPSGGEYVYPGYLYTPTTAVFVRHRLRGQPIIPTRFIRTPMTPRHSFPGVRHTGFPANTIPSRLLHNRGRR